MKKLTLSTWKLAPALAFLTLTQTTFSKENDIPLEQVPEAVIEAAKKEVPGIILLEAEVENENGKVIYELEGKREEYEYELEISEAGELLELQKKKKGE